MSAASNVLRQLRQAKATLEYQVAMAQFALDDIDHYSPAYALNEATHRQLASTLQQTSLALQGMEAMSDIDATTTTTTTSAEPASASTLSDRGRDDASTPTSASSSAEHRQPQPHNGRTAPSSTRPSSLADHRPPPVSVGPRTTGQQPRQPTVERAAGSAARSGHQPRHAATQRAAADSAAPSNGDERTSTNTTADRESNALARRRKRKYQGQPTTAKGSRVQIPSSLRRDWLFKGHARGDRNSTVAHTLDVSAFYAPELDAESSGDLGSMRAVRHKHEVEHADVVGPFTQWLQAHAAKVATSNESLSVKRRKGGPGEAGASPGEDRSAMAAASGSDDGGDAEASTTAASSAALSSDWEKDWESFRSQSPSSSLDGRASTDVRRLMTDELYVQLVRVLLDPEVELERLARERPDLHRVLFRCLLHRHRFTLFWTRVEVQRVTALSGSGARYSRLVPMLYSVDGACTVNNPDIQSCRRVMPISQVGVLINYMHCEEGHLKDRYADVQEKYCCVPRKAVQLFAKHCHGCQRKSKRTRNKPAPQRILVEEVRQRYVLDLVDLLEWQGASTGEGGGMRYVAQMIDHNSKKRWTQALSGKHAPKVRAFVARVFAEFGHPALLHTDNGAEFANEVLEGLCRSWGTYMVHGRPYHPQSQGAVENPNGVLQDVMDGIRGENKSMTDWVEVLQQATQVLNAKRHTTTRMVPNKHFEGYNRASRHKKPLLPEQSVVITVAQVEHIESLRWVRPLGPLSAEENRAVVGPPGEEKSSTAEAPSRQQDECDVVVDVDDSDEGELLSTSPRRAVSSSQPDGGEAHAAAEESSTAGVAPASSSTDDDDETASVPHPAPHSPPASHSPPGSRPRRRRRHAAQPQPPLAEKQKAEPLRLTIAAPGTRRAFSDRQLWDRKLGGVPLEMLEIEGNIGNNDCGPASAYSCLTNESASDQDAQHMRALVAAYGRSDEGRSYYELCQTAVQDQQPADLHLVVNEGQDAGVTVSHDWWTLFGGMENLNVFIFCKMTNQLAHDGIPTSVGLRLVTCGGTLVQSEEANTVAMYYQCVMREGAAKTTYHVGHFELVRTSAQPSTCLWRYDDPVVTECLMPAMESQQITVQRENATDKMLRAARARINSTNEVINVGECVWLTVHPAVVRAVKNQLRMIVQKQHCERRILCKVAAIKNLFGRSTGDAHTTFVLQTIGGIISTNFTIDQLLRASPAPRCNPVTAMSQPTPAQLAAPRGTGKGCRIKLSKAYTEYVTWTSARHAAELKNSSRQARGAAAAPAEADPATAALLSLRMETTSPSTSTADEDGMQAPLPCMLCKRTLTYSQRIGCFNSKCLAPLCRDGVGCTARRWEVSGLPYCSRRCATVDNAALDGASRSSQPLPQPRPKETAAALSATQDDGRRHQQRTVTEVVADVHCNTCLAVLRPTAGDPWCGQCERYVCKIPRGRVGCTRAGWTRGGTAKVDGLVVCVECRFAEDQEWVAFSKGSAQLGAAQQAEARWAAQQAEGNRLVMRAAMGLLEDSSDDSAYATDS